MQSFRQHDVHEDASSYPGATPLHSGHVRGFPVDSASASVHPGNGAPLVPNQGSSALISGFVHTMWPTQPAMVGNAPCPARQKGEPFYYEAGPYPSKRPPTPTRSTTFPSTYQHLRQSDGEVPNTSEAAAAAAAAAEPGRGPSDSSQTINAELLQLVQRLAPSEAAIFFKAPSPPPSLPVSPRREVDYNQLSLRPRNSSSLVPLRPSPPGSPSRHSHLYDTHANNSQQLQGGNTAGYWSGADYLVQQNHTHGLGAPAKQAWAVQQPPAPPGAADHNGIPSGVMMNGRNGLRNGFKNGANGAMARNPNLPSNAVMEERILAQHRHAAAVAYAEQARQQAQKKRKLFEAQQRARAQQLAEETAAESMAAMAAAQAVAPVHDPPPPPIEHHAVRSHHYTVTATPAPAPVDHSSQSASAPTAPPAALPGRRSSGDDSTSTGAACDLSAQSEDCVQPAPPSAAAAAGAAADAGAGASEEKKDVKAAEQMSSEGAPAQPKGVVKTYERPWLQHMRKPKEAPAQPDKPLRLPNPEIQSYIAQKRAERLRAKREAQEEADAAHQRPLGLRRLTSENARQGARKHALDADARSPPPPRAPWIDVSAHDSEEEEVSSPGRARAASPKTAKSNAATQGSNATRARLAAASAQRAALQPQEGGRQAAVDLSARRAQAVEYAAQLRARLANQQRAEQRAARARTRKIKQGIRESEMATLAAHLFPSGAAGKATKKRHNSKGPAVLAGPAGDSDSEPDEAARPIIGPERAKHAELEAVRALALNLQARVESLGQPQLSQPQLSQPQLSQPQLASSSLGMPGWPSALQQHSVRYAPGVGGLGGGGSGHFGQEVPLPLQQQQKEQHPPPHQLLHLHQQQQSRTPWSPQEADDPMEDERDGLGLSQRQQQWHQQQHQHPQALRSGAAVAAAEAGSPAKESAKKPRLSQEGDDADHLAQPAIHIPTAPGRAMPAPGSPSEPLYSPEQACDNPDLRFSAFAASPQIPVTRPQRAARNTSSPSSCTTASSGRAAREELQRAMAEDPAYAAHIQQQQQQQPYHSVTSSNAAAGVGLGVGHGGEGGMRSNSAPGPLPPPPLPPWADVQQGGSRSAADAAQASFTSSPTRNFEGNVGAILSPGGSEDEGEKQACADIVAAYENRHGGGLKPSWDARQELLHRKPRGMNSRSAASAAAHAPSGAPAHSGWDLPKDGSWQQQALKARAPQSAGGPIPASIINLVISRAYPGPPKPPTPLIQLPPPPKQYATSATQYQPQLQSHPAIALPAAPPTPLDMDAAQHTYQGLPPFLVTSAPPAPQNPPPHTFPPTQPPSTPSAAPHPQPFKPTAPPCWAPRGGPSSVLEQSMQSAPTAHQPHPAAPAGASMEVDRQAAYNQGTAENSQAAAANRLPPPWMLDDMGVPNGGGEGAQGAVRLSPAELVQQHQEQMRRYEELEALERELVQVEQARAVAAVQQEAHRIASQLDDSVAAQRSEQAAAAAAAEQERRLHESLRSLRKEMHAEGLGQLRDVASMFAQHMQRPSSSRDVAHAEAQTAADALRAAEAAAALGRQHIQRPSRNVVHAEAQTAVDALRAAEAQTGELRRREAAELGVQTSVGAADMEVQTSGELAATGGVWGAVPPQQQQQQQQHRPSTSRQSLDQGVQASTYSEDLQGPLGQSRRRSGAGQQLRATHSILASEEYSEVMEEDQQQGVTHGSSQTTSIPGSIRTAAAPASSEAYSPATSMHSQPPGSQAPSASIIESEGMAGAASGRPSTAGQPHTGSLQRTRSAGADPSTPPRAGSPSSSASAGSVSSSIRSQSALRDGGRRRRRTDELGQQGARTPAAALRASATGELDIDPEQWEAMRAKWEAHAREDLAVLNGRLEATRSDAHRKLQRARQQLHGCPDAATRGALMRLERTILCQLDVDVGRIQRQILQIKEDNAVLELSVQRFQRLAAELSSARKANHPSPSAPSIPYGATLDTPTRSTRTRPPSVTDLVADQDQGRAVSNSGRTSGSSASRGTQQSVPEESIAESLRTLAGGKHDGTSGSVQDVYTEEFSSGRSGTADRSGSSGIAESANLQQQQQQQQRSAATGTVSWVSQDQQQKEGTTGPSVPSTDGYSSSRSSELEAQRQNLAAALEQKRTELAAEQKRHQSAQKRQAVADTQQQLAEMTSQIQRLRQQEQTQQQQQQQQQRAQLGQGPMHHPQPFAAAAAPSASASEAYTMSGEATASIAEEDTATKIGPKGADAANTTASISEEIPASSAAQSSGNDTHTGSGVSEEPGVPGPGWGAPQQQQQQQQQQHAVSPQQQEALGDDSLELEQQKLRQLQVQVEQAKRQAARAQLAAEQARLQEELRAAQAAYASAFASTPAHTQAPPVSHTLPPMPPTRPSAGPTTQRKAAAPTPAHAAITQPQQSISGTDTEGYSDDFDERSGQGQGVQQGVSGSSISSGAREVAEEAAGKLPPSGGFDHSEQMSVEEEEQRGEDEAHHQQQQQQQQPSHDRAQKTSPRSSKAPSAADIDEEQQEQSDGAGGSPQQSASIAGSIEYSQDAEHSAGSRSSRSSKAPSITAERSVHSVSQQGAESRRSSKSGASSVPSADIEYSQESEGGASSRRSRGSDVASADIECSQEGSKHSGGSARQHSSGSSKSSARSIEIEYSQEGGEGGASSRRSRASKAPSVEMDEGPGDAGGASSRRSRGSGAGSIEIEYSQEGEEGGVSSRRSRGSKAPSVEIEYGDQGAQSSSTKRSASASRSSASSEEQGVRSCEVLMDIDDLQGASIEFEEGAPEGPSPASPEPAFSLPPHPISSIRSEGGSPQQQQSRPASHSGSSASPHYDEEQQQQQLSRRSSSHSQRSSPHYDEQQQVQQQQQLSRRSSSHSHRSGGSGGGRGSQLPHRSRSSRGEGSVQDAEDLYSEDFAAAQDEGARSSASSAASKRSQPKPTPLAEAPSPPPPKDSPGHSASASSSSSTGRSKHSARSRVSSGRRSKASSSRSSRHSSRSPSSSTPSIQESIYEGEDVPDDHDGAQSEAYTALGDSSLQQQQQQQSGAVAGPTDKQANESQAPANPPPPAHTTSYTQDYSQEDMGAGREHVPPTEPTLPPPPPAAAAAVSGTKEYSVEVSHGGSPNEGVLEGQSASPQAAAGGDPEDAVGHHQQQQQQREQQEQQQAVASKDGGEGAAAAAGEGAKVPQQEQQEQGQQQQHSEADSRPGSRGGSSSGALEAPESSQESVGLEITQPQDLAEGSGESSGGLEASDPGSEKGPHAHAVSAGSDDSDLEGVQTAFNQASRGMEDDDEEVSSAPSDLQAGQRSGRSSNLEEYKVESKEDREGGSDADEQQPSSAPTAHAVTQEHQPPSPPPLSQPTAEETTGAAPSQVAAQAEAPTQQPQPAAAAVSASEGSSSSIVEEEGLDEHAGDDDEGSISGEQLFGATPAPHTPPPQPQTPSIPPPDTPTSAPMQPHHPQAPATAPPDTPTSSAPESALAAMRESKETQGPTDSQSPQQLHLDDAFALSESALSEGTSPMQTQTQQAQAQETAAAAAAEATRPAAAAGTTAPLADDASARQQQQQPPSEPAPPAAPPSAPAQQAPASESSSRSSAKLSDYSMSFDGMEEDIEVDAATSGRQPQQQQPQPEGPSSKEIAEQITQDTMRRVFNDSVETMVNVAGGPDALPASSATSADAAAGAASAHQGPTYASLSDSWGEGVSRPEVDPKAPQLQAESSSHSAAGSISDDDLGWGMEGAEEFGEFEVNVGGMLVPEHEQALRQQAAQEEAAAAAAAVVPPNVVNTPASVGAYVEQVMRGALQEGPLPEVLSPGQEPLSLEGFLAQERTLDVTDAQHIANKLLYDATNEALTNVYKAANRVKAPLTSSRKRVVKPMPPPDVLVAEVKKQVLDWSSVNVQGEANMETLLAAAAVEEDRAWFAMEEEEEVNLKLEIADEIWGDLLTDTARVVADLDSKLSQRR